MWQVLQAVQYQSKVTQDKVLQAVRPLLSAKGRREWPKTRLQIDNRINKTVGSFYPRVTRHADIKLNRWNIVGLEKPVRFTFIDPIFAWVRCANKLSHQHHLHFKYEELRHPDTGELLYGSSVANGLIMKRACEKVPVNNSNNPSGPALIGLSWDAGNATKRRSYTPILISVGNSNCSGSATCTCIGYLPRLKLSQKVSSSKEGQAAQFELAQACAKVIINVIEQCAERGGFKCLLHTTTGESVRWTLLPLLVRMEFDTKERYKFFGLNRQRACAIGSGPRKGRSLFRPCTPHSSRKSPTPDSLSRHGVHPERNVKSLKNLKFCVLSWPRRIYHGLFAFDVLHVLYINCIRYLQEALLDLLTPTQQKILDTRIRAFTPFRNPVTGQTSPKVTSLTSIGYLSAEQRVLHLFVWSHAVGSRADIFEEELREYVLKSICSLQVMCYVARGKRPFTQAEHRYTYIKVSCPHDMLARHAWSTCLHDTLGAHACTTCLEHMLARHA